MDISLAVSTGLGLIYLFFEAIGSRFDLHRDSRWECWGVKVRGVSSDEEMELLPL